jgi:hypothetical protein
MATILPWDHNERPPQGCSTFLRTCRDWIPCNLEDEVTVPNWHDVRVHLFLGIMTCADISNSDGTALWCVWAFNATTNPHKSAMEGNHDQTSGFALSTRRDEILYQGIRSSHFSCTRNQESRRTSFSPPNMAKMVHTAISITTTTRTYSPLT